MALKKQVKQLLRSGGEQAVPTAIKALHQQVVVTRRRLDLLSSQLQSVETALAAMLEPEVPAPAASRGASTAGRSRRAGAPGRERPAAPASSASRSGSRSSTASRSGSRSSTPASRAGASASRRPATATRGARRSR